MPICPAGHQTSQSDFCDTCGLPVSAGQADAAPAAPVAPAVAEPLTCPHCGTANVADALFCEACGYDFTTGAMPVVETAPAIAWPTVAAGPSGQPAPAGPSGPVGSPDVSPAPGAPPAVSSDHLIPADAPAAQAPAVPARPPVEWVAELWIDPDWYAAQGSTDPLPSPGLPDIVPLVKESNLIGRVSQSRGIFPDVDCEIDTGCSRRHAMLTTDGTRWWIEDLNSANGTFVGAAAGPLPAMPIPQGRVELSAGQRIYVGAWTRIVVRRATLDEAEVLAG
jgi:hypothetical protein